MGIIEITEKQLSQSQERLMVAEKGLHDIKKHMEFIVVGQHELSGVWQIADRTLSQIAEQKEPTK